VHEAVLAGGDPHDQGRPRPLRADLLLHVQGAPSPAAPSAAASLPDAQLSDSPGRLARDLCRAGLHELAGSGGVLQVFGTLGGDMVHWRPGAAALRRVAPLLGAATTAAPVGLAHRLRGFAGLPENRRARRRACTSPATDASATRAGTTPSRAAWTTSSTCPATAWAPPRWRPRSPRTARAWRRPWSGATLRYPNRRAGGRHSLPGAGGARAAQGSTLGARGAGVDAGPHGGRGGAPACRSPVGPAGRGAAREGGCRADPK